MEGVSHDAVAGVSLDAGVGVGVDARVREHGLVSDQALSSAFLVVARGRDRFSFQDVSFDGKLCCVIVYLGSWGRVDVFLPWWLVSCGCCGRVFGDRSWEENCSFACSALNWFSVRYLTKMLIAMMIDHNGGDYTEDDDGDGDDSDDDDYLPPGRHPPAG